jgi:hypothetical protein
MRCRRKFHGRSPLRARGGRAWDACRWGMSVPLRLASASRGACMHGSGGSGRTKRSSPLRPEAVDWIVADLGIAPQKALRAMQRFFPPYRRSLLGLAWTLKLNEWSFAEEIPSWLEQLRQFGLSELRATQLPSNRQECCVVGLTPRGADTA